MHGYKKIIQLKIIAIFVFFISSTCIADNHNFNEILELIQKDLKTLERAVYSGSINNMSDSSKNSN